MKKITNILIPALALSMLIFTIVSISKKRVIPPRELVNNPPISSAQKKIAALGIVEPSSKFINVGSHKQGVVDKIYVHSGDTLSKGDPLFLIDDKETIARFKEAKAKSYIARVHYEDLKYNLSLFESIKDKRSISISELNKKRFAVTKAKAEIDHSQANVDVIKATLDNLTVRSPIDGQVLKVNIEEGEYLSQNVDKSSSIIMGNTKVMNVRASIDESDIHKLQHNPKAIGILHSMTDHEIPLKFIKIEPYVLPKQNLNNNSAEKIDTRVLEILFSFDNLNVNAIPGQKMDVFIQW